jgi:LysM domain-containing protein
MFSNQLVTASRVMIIGFGAACLLALHGCALFRHGSPQTATAQAVSAPVSETDTSAPAEPATVTEAAEEAGDTAAVLSDAGPAVKAGAPKSYTVQRGDTLWGIANMFLRDPWLWPEIWFVNPQIENPHRIYPGDMVRLAYGADGKTQLQLVRGNAVRLSPLLRSSALEGPIATIPYAVIASFLSRPGVLTMDEVKHAPYVLALRDQHIIGGAGHELYVKKLGGETGARYSVMHVDAKLRDPDSGAVLGYMGVYTGTAKVTTPGEIAKVVLTDSARETLQGDVLVAEDVGQSADFSPHAPARAVSGQIVAVVDSVLLAGEYQVVALNRGTRDGLERGHVLTVDEAAKTTRDRCARIDGTSTCWWTHKRETLPTESAGTLLVFKTYERISYALVVGETSPIGIGDHIRNP